MEKRLQFQIKSKIENIYPVERTILDQAKEYEFDSEACFNLRLAMDEAFSNAIIHGNRNAEEKDIMVEAAFQSNCIAVTVRDEGDGFDRTKLIDPREISNLFKTNGRGVFLIRQFTHEVKFNEKGNEITFIVQRSRTASVLKSH